MGRQSRRVRQDLSFIDRGLKSITLNMIIRQYKFGILIAIAFTLLLYSCNEKPTDISYNMLSDTLDIVHTNSFERELIKKSESVYTHQRIFNAGAILIGNYEEFNSFNFMRFETMPDSLSYLTPDDIDSVVVTMYPGRYALGDTLSNYIGFDVYQVDHYWTNITTLDTIYEDPTGKPYLTDRLVGSWEGLITLKDTLAPISFNLDKSLFSEWLQLQPDTNAAVVNWGIAFMPKENCTSIQQFRAYQSTEIATETTLKAFFTNKDGEKDTVSFIAAINKSFPSAPEPEEGQLIMQAGVRYNTNFDIDLTSIPDLSGIHLARLELWLDSESSTIGNMGVDSLFHISVDLDDETTLSSVGALDRASGLYTFYDMVLPIEWTLRNGKEQTLSVSFVSYNELARQMDRIVFFGMNAADTSKRPKLELVYSTRPTVCNK